MPVNYPPGSSPVWGDLTGTLSDQTDLQTALDGKSSTGHTHNGLAPTGGTTGQVLKKASNTNFDYAWDTDETSAGGGVTLDEVIDALYPVGALYVSTLSTNPGTLLGRGTWAAFGAGRVMVGHDSGDTDFDTGEETGGAKTKAISAHAGTAVADHASHTHTYTEIVQHAHTVNITDNGHTHTQASQTATTGGVSSWEHGAIDTSSTAAETLNTGSSTTGITATTSNPAGSVATGTTNGPSATLTHTVTQPSAHTDLNVVQPYVVCYFWKRTA